MAATTPSIVRASTPFPRRPPRVAVAAAGPDAAKLAGRIGDALISTAPDRDLVESFADSGGEGKPCYGQLTVCWAENRERAVEIAYERWRNGGLTGDLGQELALPRHFRQATGMLRREQVAEQIVCGPDPERHLEAIEEFQRAGFDRVYIHQVGSEQQRAIEFYEQEILPQFGRGAESDPGSRAPAAATR